MDLDGEELGCSGERPARHLAADVQRAQLGRGHRLAVELQTKVAEDYAKFYNHGESPNEGLFLVMEV